MLGLNTYSISLVYPHWMWFNYGNENELCRASTIYTKGNFSGSCFVVNKQINESVIKKLFALVTCPEILNLKSKGITQCMRIIKNLGRFSGQMGFSTNPDTFFDLRIQIRTNKKLLFVTFFRVKVLPSHLCCFYIVLYLGLFNFFFQGISQYASDILIFIPALLRLKSLKLFYRN